MVYEDEEMVSVQIDDLNWRRIAYDESDNSYGLDNCAYLLD